MKYETLLRKTAEFWSPRLGRSVTPDEAERLLEGIPDFVERLYAWGAGDRVVLQEPREIPARRRNPHPFDPPRI